VRECPVARLHDGWVVPFGTMTGRAARFELVLVVLVSLVVLAPGIGSYTLVDPWETHYGEVARMMLQNDDWVHTEWPGSMSGSFDENEGFRSKPVLQFWMMAAGMRAMGVAADGGYSGELTDTSRVMIGIRLPFILSAIAGLTLLWWMLARLVSRRMAWLGLLIVGGAPMFCMMARMAIPDMPMVACTIGAVALFTLALEDGERPIRPLWQRGRLRIDGRHVVLALAGGFVAIQAVDYAIYFIAAPRLGINGRILTPALWLPLMMAAMLGGLSRDGWLVLRLPFVLIGGVLAAIAGEPRGTRQADQSRWRHVVDNTLRRWDRHALDRYVLRGLVFALVRAHRGTWASTETIAAKLLRIEPITTMRQVYLLACYSVLGISVLAKGPPGLAVVGVVGALHVLLLGRWRALYDGAFELKRGLLLMIVTFVPWHLVMFLKEGPIYINEYVFMHVLDRAAVGVDNSPGTFAYYTDQIGYGMWLWAALLPAALAATFVRARLDSREGRVRFMIGLWSIAAVAVFCLIQTKFHHYILPAIPPLGLLVAFLLDDIYARRERLHLLFAALGAGIVLLICRDLMFEPDRWIEMFVFLYNRPWPGAEPYAIDPSDGFLVLGIAGAAAILVLGTRFARIGVVAVAGVGVAICIWALQVYMPIAGTHWGMGDAARTYYEQRTIYGQQLVYFGTGQLHDDWAGAGDTWSFETKIPDAFQVGQPMTLDIRVHEADAPKVSEQQLVLAGTATSFGDHSITITLAPGERARLAPLIASGANGKRGARPPIRIVDADRLLAYQLYWRGENFWSAEEILGFLPETKTAFPNPNNAEITKYLADRSRMPLGRRYFVLAAAGTLANIKALLPTQRGKDTFDIIDRTSNKFWLGSFTP
jgi:4-amino-4-deoxy-L-arabinose transferase-like glycosyltransferase